MILNSSPTTSNSDNQELKRLHSRIEQLEKELIASQIRTEVYLDTNNKLRAYIQSLENKLVSVQKRNSELENPGNSPRYATLSWRGKVIFCLRKLKQPLRLQEIVAELEIMEAETGGFWESDDKLISVVLAKAVQGKALHIEKVPATRGAYYALPEWLDESGGLSSKMKRKLG